MPMSRTDFSVVLSPLAKLDLEDIQIYTLEKWGETQRKKYAALLYEGLQKLAVSPEFGHKRRDLSTDHRACRIGHHFAVYRVVGTEIQISRILHEKMDFRQREGQH